MTGQRRQERALDVTVMRNLLWEQEVGGSNPLTPIFLILDLKMLELFTKLRDFQALSSQVLLFRRNGKGQIA